MRLTHSVSIVSRTAALGAALLGIFLSVPAAAGANSAPSISGTPATTATVGQAYSFVPSASDPDGDELRFVIKNRPSWASFSYQTGGLSGTPTEAGSWSDIIIYVKDGQFTRAMPKFSIEVLKANGQPAANAPPVISGDPPTTAAVGQHYSFEPAASDPDGDQLRFVIKNRPSWASFSYQTGGLSGTPTKTGTWSNIVIYAKDGTYTTALSSFSINVVADGNSAPKISGSPSSAATVGQSYDFQPSASDADGDALGFSIQNKPSWASFSTATGRLSGTPSSAGAYSNITISVSDGKASASLPAFSISAVAGNSAPTISGSPGTAVNASDAYSFQPTAMDADGDTLAFSVSNKPSWAAFNTSTGKLYGTPGAADVGTYSNISIRVSDGQASATLPSFAINVNQMSLGSATLSWNPPSQNTDGSQLADLAGYRILYGTSSASLTQSIQIGNASVTTYVLENLVPGTYYFAVRAYNDSGVESANSNIASKAVQ